MKPLITVEQDAATLQEIGRASLQIVHDLKNQLNGLKLYATFLRRRMKRDARPADEIETIDKLMQGLDRASEDATLLVRYGRPLELRRKPTDLQIMLKGYADFDASDEPLTGDFDAQLLAEALRLITASIESNSSPQDVTRAARGGVEKATDESLQAVIEWRGLNLPISDDATFRSFVGGRGLRLALAAKIVEAHGGAISYEGQTLRLRVPLAG